MFNNAPNIIQQSNYGGSQIPINLNYFNAANDQKNNQLDKSQAPHRTRFPFSAKEDQLLIQLVKQFGINDKINWYYIAMHIEGRSARQCRERYQLYLSEGIKRKEKWTKEEDELLLEKYSALGPKWKKMEQYFEGRTSYSIKNRYISLKKKKNKANPKDLQDQVLPKTSNVIKRYCLPLKFKKDLPPSADGKDFLSVVNNII